MVSYVEKVEVEEKARPIVQDFMVDAPVVFKLGDEIYSVMKSLLAHKVTGAPVLAESGDIAGFISEKDCLKVVALNAYHGGRRGGKVEDYMTGQSVLTTVTPQTGLYKVAQMFLALPYKKLLVVDEEKLLGLVRRSVVLRVVAK